jgi:hypothetical protein
MYSQGLTQAVGSEFLYGRSQKVSLDEIARAPCLLLYFSASYCPISQRFNEFLFPLYMQINSPRKVIEIIVVAKERNEVEHRKYTDRLPCVYLPYDFDRSQELFRRYAVRDIPQVLLMKRDDGSILTRDAKAHLEADGPRVLERWRKQFGRLVD